MLYHWMSSTLSQQQQPTTQQRASGSDDQSNGAAEPAAFAQALLQFCTNLLVAGVIKQIPDIHAPEQDTFRVSPSINYRSANKQ